MAATFSQLPVGASPVAVFAFSEEQHVAAVCTAGVFVRRALVDEALAPLVRGDVCAACPTQGRNSMLVVLSGADGQDTDVVEAFATGVVVPLARGFMSRPKLICTNDRHVVGVSDEGLVAVFSFDHMALLRTWYPPGREAARQCRLSASGELCVQFRCGARRAFTLHGVEICPRADARFEASVLQTRTCDAFYDLRGKDLMELPWMPFPVAASPM